MDGTRKIDPHEMNLKAPGARAGMNNHQADALAAAVMLVENMTVRLAGLPRELQEDAIRFAIGSITRAIAQSGFDPSLPLAKSFIQTLDQQLRDVVITRRIGRA